MTKCLSTVSLDESILSADKKSCHRFGSCGVGVHAVYLAGRLIDRFYYIPIRQIRRIYKVIAMSRGGYSGKGIFGTIPYLVVEYDDGKKTRTTFKREEKVDALLAYMAEHHPEIPVRSAAAEERLAKAEAERQARICKNLTPEAVKTIERLSKAKDYLDAKPVLCQRLAAASKAQRVIEAANPTYKYVALVITAGGVISAGYGIFSMLSGSGDFGLYFLLFGLAAIMFFSSANVMPTALGHKKAVRQAMTEALNEMERYLKGYDGKFPLPACYAHPVALDRMIRSVREGRAEDVPGTYELLKSDLKALNANVQVSQEEYDEVVTIKPMFLLNDYQ